MIKKLKIFSASSAFKFIILIGIADLFADMTYEGSRAIIGPYLGTLGASAAVVGIVAGFAELVGYGLRIVSGYLADKTGKYWAITIFGYALNLFAVPALALAGRWEVAAALIIAERTGKAIRAPVRDAMLSHATKEIGRGWGFGLHEAMDQIGATIGPLIVTAVLFFRSSYHEAFGALLVSALASLSILIAGKFIYPRPRDFEVHGPELKTKGLSRRFWLYVVAVGFIGAGFADFPLIAFHFQKISSVPEIWIPAFYAVAMGIDAIAALVLGYLFDRKGMGVLIVIPFISALFAPLVFMGNFGLALLGMAFWGIGMGALESIVKAAVGELAPADRRASAYGIFFTGFGIFWFIGSAAMGLLYDYSIPWLVLFSVIMQLISVPFLIHVSRSGQK